MVKSVILRAVSLIVAVSMLMLVAPGAGTSEPYDVKDPENCQLCLNVFSDVHVEGNNYPRDKVFAQSLKDLEKNVHGCDAYLFLGDSTMNGQNIENLIFHGLCSIYLKDQKVIPVPGNHDFGNGEGDFEKIQQRWYDYTKAFFGLTLNKPYYYEIVNGFWFIVLANEQQNIDAMHMSEAQYEWLARTLRKAATSGLPVFVLAHYPPGMSSPIDPDSQYDLRRMLAEYNKETDVFYLCGHLHADPSDYSFHTWNAFPDTYLPSLGKLTEDGQIYEGSGYGEIVEVYPDRVVFRMRNFYYGEWALQNGEPFEREFFLKNPIPTPEA